MFKVLELFLVAKYKIPLFSFSKRNVDCPWILLPDPELLKSSWKELYERLIQESLENLWNKRSQELQHVGEISIGKYVFEMFRFHI